jgi:hypothetical protein
VSNGWDDLFGNDTAFTIDDAVDITWNNYEDDYEAYWGIRAAEAPAHLTHEEWLALRDAFAMGKEAGKVALALVASQSVTAERIAQMREVEQFARRFDDALRNGREAARRDSDPERVAAFDHFRTPYIAEDPRTLFGVFNNALQFALAGDLVPSIGRAGDRARRLLELVMEISNPRVAAYLSRVARCYCLDLPTEMAVMARATIDAALEELVPDEVVERSVGANRRGQISLASRVQAAFAIDAIDKESFDALQGVKSAGDNAAHASPGLVPPSEEQLNTLAKALGGIFKRCG